MILETAADDVLIRRNPAGSAGNEVAPEREVAPAGAGGCVGRGDRDPVAVGVRGDLGSPAVLHRGAAEARQRDAELRVVMAWQAPGGELGGWLASEKGALRGASGLFARNDIGLGDQFRPIGSQSKLNGLEGGHVLTYYELMTTDLGHLPTAAGKWNSLAAE
ncbi:hypothetical protein ABT084_18955 [Streptomyces sp. NPDC002138]|uniref:hypothetical protein n=1 Tax=Streptomyces sp. NPDC002138 TaxID=3154410 RepID=UPI00332B4C54